MCVFDCVIDLKLTYNVNLLKNIIFFSVGQKGEKYSQTVNSNL